MRLGYLHIMEPMQNCKGYVVLCWHRKSWWSWGIWYRPAEATWKNVWKIHGWRRYLALYMGKRGEISFQSQM
jgi:hypothetical protein